MTLLPDTAESLRQESVSVENITDEHRQIANDLREVMIANDGAAIAAPQVGLNIKMIVVRVGDGFKTMINPVIMKKSGSATENEGCLTYPGLFIQIKRSESVTVKWKDLNNKMQYGTFTGFEARAIQHEVDHLKGILFTERNGK